MMDATLLGPWVRRFLLEHLIGERNLARNTQRSYRDTLALLLPFTATSAGLSVDRLTIDHLSAERVRAFLRHLEEARGCAPATCNQRLAAVHAFARFIGTHRPEHIAWAAQLRAIPFKRTTRPVMAYLDKPEMDALLAVPDPRTAQGRRDHALLLFLYNSGSRADEAAHVRIADLELGRSPGVALVGKGHKLRRCPLWPLTAQHLAPLVTGRGPAEPVFLNQRHQPLTRFGIHALVKRTVRRASGAMPSLRTKRVSAHTIRHSTAVHLLRAGVDLNTIRAWLGHVSLDTTHAYAEIDFEMKARALAHVEIPIPPRGGKRWRDDHGLLAFLRAL
jgi:site-specific recombinase XerD